MAARNGPTARRTKTDMIADEIIGNIVSGRLQPGDRIESERRLTERFGVSLGTVQKALGALEHRGIVVREHGRGTFVTHGNTTVDARFVRFQDAEGQQLPLYIHLLSVRRVMADGRWLAFFGRPRELARIDRLMNVGNRFDLFSEFALHADAFDEMVKDAPDGFVRNVRQAIADRLMLPTVRVEQEIRFDAWPNRVSSELGCPKDTVGFVMELRGYTLEDKPLFYQRVFADRFRNASLVIER